MSPPFSGRLPDFCATEAPPPGENYDTNNIQPEGDDLRQTAYKPGFVHPPLPRLWWTVWPFLWDDSCLPPLATYPDGYPETGYVPSLFGLAPGGACRAVPVARTAVRSYRTISTSPPRPRKSGGSAVCFLWRYP